MFRVLRVRGGAVCALLLVTTSAFAASFTSTQTGDWNNTATWGGAGVPGTGDDVTITSNHVVTVTDSRVALTVTLDSTAGNKMLVVDSTGTLLVESAIGPAIAINAPSPGSTNIVFINGGQLETSGIGTGISITGGAANASKLEFTSLGGTARFVGDVVFAGPAANAQIDFGPSTGTVEIGGDLGSGGTFINNTGSTVVIAGTGAQTINGYTFNHFTVNKAGGTATLNGPIAVNGNFTITQGVLDDGGNQISLNGGGTSAVTVSGTGVLKLGSAASATFFPTPLGTATLNAGSAVVYQSGLQQTINTAMTYDRLYLATLGGAVSHILSGGTLIVDSQLDITDNGVNTVTLSLGTGTLDLKGELTGDGTVSMTSGSMEIAGNFSPSASLSAGTGTVTYDGAGAQSVLGATYHNLSFNKTGGTATFAGNATINGDLSSLSLGILDAGSNTITLLGGFTNSMTFLAANATIKLNGVTPQAWTDSAATTIGTLEFNNPSPVSFGNFATITTALNLYGGVVSITGSFFIDVAATVNRTTGWFDGPVRMGFNLTPARTFHIGTAAAYLPVTVDAGSAGTLTMYAVDGQTPDRTANNVLDRFWRIQSGTVTPIDSITFNYNQTDVTTGDETKYILASYDSGTLTFTHYGDVNDVGNNATATSVTSYLQDWVIGQPGSLAAASKLAITTVNGGSDPQAVTAFDVVVEAQDDDGTPTPVFDPTGISLSVATGTGTIGGTTTGTIGAGTDTTTISGVTYSIAENSVQLGVARTSGDLLDPGTSTSFNVLAAPSTLTVTNLLDSGAGSLRDAITTANTGGCTSPCTIELGVSGEINLSSALPAIIVSNLTIDGYTAPGASANTNAYGLASNAVITVAINGGGTVNFGFDIQETFVKIAGFAIKNFTNAGVRFTGDNSGSNVSGCAIGTDTSGSIAAPNAAGVLFSASTESTLGGLLPAARNVISGNTTWGVTVEAASNTVGILGNYIGTNAALTAALANNNGLSVCNGCSVSLGASGVGNVVSGNTGSGIVLAGNGTSVVAHYIGTAGSGTTAIPNTTGIQIDSTASSNTIGGASPSDVNVISGNSQNGILVQGNDNTIDNNLIGIAADGTTPRANGGSGVRIENTASGNFVGTTNGNKIANNANDGVTVTGTGIGNVVRRGKIAGNTNRAIDLADNGTTSNDATDTDTGANNLQNFPTISEAKYNAGNVDVKLSLDSSGGVSTNFFIFDVYKADASIPAQAIEYLGNSGCLAGNVFANTTVSVPAGTAVVGNSVVATATAYSDAACTTPSEGTSELSASTRIGGDIHWIAGTGNWETASNWNPAVTPTSADNAFIDNSGTYTVTINSIANVASVYVGNASGTQTLVIGTSQSLNLNSGASTVTSNGVLTMNGIGINAASAALTISGVFNWNIGTITGAGGVTMASGGTLNIDTASAKGLNAGGLTIAGGATANWNGGAINVSNAGFIDNFGLFEIKSDSTLNNGISAGTFDNTGTLRKSTTTGTTTFSNITLNHTGGSVDVQTGTLNLAGGSASAPIAISSGATLLIDDNTFTLSAGASSSGAGKIHINGGTLSVNTADTLPNVQLDSGTLDGTANVAITSLLWNGGTMSGAGTTTIPAAGSATISTASAKSLQRTFAVAVSANATVNGAGAINLANGGNITNAGTFEVTAPTTFNDSFAGGDFANSGTFRANTAGTVTFSATALNGNAGTIEVLSGTLDLADGTNIAAITVGSGATLLINSDVYTFGSGTTVSGLGTVSLTGGTLSVTGNVAIPQFSQTNGTLDGAGTVTFTNTATWQTGTWQGGGTTTVGATATLDLTTPSAKALNNRTFTSVAGATINLSGNGPINLSNGASIANGGTLAITADNTFNDSLLSGNIVNTGTIRKQTATGPTSFTNISLTNNGGLVDIQSGTLSFTGDTFTQTAGSTLKVWLNGTTPGTGFGQLSSNGSVNLAGTLEVALVGPYQPIGGDTFRVISAPGHVGDFTQPYTYPTLANSRTFSDAYDGSGLLLTVNGNADLSISKSAPSNVVAGGAISYTLNVNNAGPDTANSVSVTDVLQTGHTSISASGTGWTCNVVSLTVTCTAATLNTGAAPPITINANAPTTPQTFTNVANVASTNDSNNTNDSGSAPVTVDPLQAELALTVSGPASPVAQSTAFTFTFTITNNGPQTASSVAFSAPIPATLTYSSATPDAGTCNFAGGTVTCNVGNILSAASLNIAVNLSTTTTAGTHTVTGSASATEVDPNGANNSVNAVVEVSGSTITVINTNDSGAGSLRQALNDAASGVCTPLPCTIAFNIPGGPPHIIQPPTVELPLVQSQTIIDATTQPGYAGTPLVQIDGQGILTYAFSISGNNNAVRGLSITGFSYGIDVAGDNNTIEANYVGLNTLGAIAANGDGVRVRGNTNTVGGTTPAQRNVISGNTSDGVFVEGNVSGNQISGNFIGTDPAGTSARPNATGVAVTDNADSTTIGGTTAAHANVISGNTDYGVYIQGAGTVVIAAAGEPATSPAADAQVSRTGNDHFSNRAPGATSFAVAEIDDTPVGTPALRTDAAGDGILDGTVVRNNVIGSTTLGAGIAGIAIVSDAKNTTVSDNTIAGNQTGIALFGGDGAQILQNSIHDQTALGIDIDNDGVTPNDATDADTGANGLQNFPTLTTAVLIGGGNMSISSNIDSSGSPAGIGSIRIDYFEADASGEGQTWLGFACVAGNSFGLTTTGISAPSVLAGDPIVATATSFTDAACTTVADGTSEFSNVILAANCTPPPVTITGPTQMCTGASVVLDAGAGFASYSWSNGATTQTINVSPGTTTVYTVTVTDNLGCTNSDTHTVTVDPLPVVAITGPTATCVGTPVTLDAGPGFAGYAWSTGATTQTITVSPAATTNYSVTVTDGNACSATDTHTVTVTSNPTATIAAPPAVCENSTGNSASVAAQAGASYVWTIGNGTITAGQGTNAITFDAGPAGTATLGVTVTAGSCTSNGSANVPITATPVVTITGPTSVCENTSITLDAGAGFTTYLWSNGATTQTITVAPPVTQTYSVTVTSGSASCSATDAHTVNVTPAPSAVINAPSPVAANATGIVASVAVQPGATYSWSISNGTITSGNGTSSITFTAGSSGITHLHATVSLGGCNASFTYAVFIEGSSQPADADLAVTKSAPGTVQPGASLTYTIGLRNFGPGAASSVVLTDTLPAGTTFVAMNPGPWNCTRNGATITCTGTSAPAGTNSTITVTVKAPPQSGIITNTVQITSATTDPNGANNSASASTSVASPLPDCPAAPPSLLLPVDGASLVSPVLFTATSVAGASEYELWIDNALASVAVSPSFTRSLPSGTSSWFVIARFPNGCEPLVSDSRTLTILQSNTCASNTAPQITVPDPGIVGPATTFMWTPVAQAIGYRVWIEVDGTAAQDAGTTNGANTLSVALPPGSIVAYVDALFANCPPARSAPVALTVPQPDPCAARTTAQPLTPANDAVVHSSSVELTWSEAADADGYRVWYSLDGAPFAVLGTTTSDTSLKAAIGPGVADWYVETLHDGCASTKSQTRRFTIPARNDCAATTPATISPANGSTVANATVQFAWSSVPGAVTYELWASVNDGTFVLMGTTHDTTLARIVPAGKIDWFVRAIVDRCGARDSQISRFTQTPPEACSANDRPLLVSPLRGAKVSAPIRFDWDNAGAAKYELFLMRGDSAPQLIATTTATDVDDVNIEPGKIRWFVRAHFGPDCAPLDSGERRLEVVPQPAACVDLHAPVISAPGQVSSDIPFLLQWTPVNGATAYQVLIAGNASFDGAGISTVTAPELLFEGANATENPILRYIRVRAINGRCQPTGISPYGPAHVLVILPKSGGVGSAPFGTETLVMELELGPQYAGQTFTATPKQPWITVAPANGVVPAGGIKLTVTVNASELPVGTTIGSIDVAFSNAGRGVATNDGPVGFPLGISLVTPVTPAPTNTPPPDALIIPAIAHADGINSHFQSDVRVSNTSAQLVTYQLTFTPSGDSGITQGQQTTFSVEPGRTIALDDILKSWFSTGTGSAMGTLEIRPLTQLATSTQGTAFTGLANLASFASSRTFNVTSNGTFGQYIPAIPFANFIGSQRILSLQQIAQSARYRTNLGIVEGSGNPASLLVRMFGESGQSLGSFPLNLNGGQHIQLNSFLRDHGVDNLDDGRVEVEVLSPDGKITAYASVLDNRTSDPLLVTPVEIHSGGATKWVVPGVADLASGFANWQTDMRVFNAGTEDVDAIVAFYSQNGGTPKTASITIPAGQVRQFDKALTALFGASNDGGAVHITTTNAARLIATARTYNQVSGGTYGQFISAVTPNEAAGAGDRPLQLLQVEETARFRSNIGLVEVTGNPVRLEISAVPPDAKFTAVTEVFLGANEFRQLGSLLRSMGLADTHNARVTVRVLDGPGRVTAYASVIDMLTNDPTYVPAQ